MKVTGDPIEGWAMSRRVDHCLGIQKMPEGYALMIDDDDMYFYWLCDDGRESVIHWNKWAIWRGAVADARAKVVKASIAADGVQRHGEARRQVLRRDSQGQG